MTDLPYKKAWLVRTRVARGLISTPCGSQLPTLEEYCKALGCSRRVVQDALTYLLDCGAIKLDKRGKLGTFLTEKNDDILFEGAGLSFYVGSMPIPHNIELSGLATGICQAMSRCPLPFSFAFVQGGKNRARDLNRRVYDFVIATKATARECIKMYPDIVEAFSLKNCAYSPPYTLFINAGGVDSVQDGMSVAVDPTCLDQLKLTELVCKDKKVQMRELSYISTAQAFLAGDVDCAVMRGDMGSAYQIIDNLNVPYNAYEHALNMDKISAIPVTAPDLDELQLPVVLVSTQSYGMAGILKTYLGDEKVSEIQHKVILQEMTPQFY